MDCVHVPIQKLGKSMQAYISWRQAHKREASGTQLCFIYCCPSGLSGAAGGNVSGVRPGDDCLLEHSRLLAHWQLEEVLRGMNETRKRKVSATDPRKTLEKEEWAWFRQEWERLGEARKDSKAGTSLPRSLESASGKNKSAFVNRS